MNNSIETMLNKYDCHSSLDYKNALKEIIQEIALCGLSRGGFFSQAAFYGGTALRIFYGLDRFSEDMDFSLIAPDSEFDIQNYFSFVKSELEANGFELSVEKKLKSKATDIQSAFIKGQTLIHLLKIAPSKEMFSDIMQEEVIKIKFEVDTNPPDCATFEIKYALNPIPFAVKMYDQSSLFAGKLHAILCRAWKDRVKGRDFYDYVWYLSKNIKPNLAHLQKRLEQSNKWDSSRTLDIASLNELLIERFSTINFDNAKEDVKPFIKDLSKLDLWSKDFFTQITQAYLQ